MNKLVRSWCSLLKKLRGYFRGRDSFEKRFLEESVLFSAENCSRELPHNNPNSRTQRYCNFFFELQTVRIKYKVYNLADLHVFG